MDIKHFEQKLLEKQREYEAVIGALEDEARDDADGDVKDSGDLATADLSTSEVLDEGTRATEILEEIQDALQRIKDGTYGKCVECGRAIEPARLEAIPWTPYCLEDQEKRDAAAMVHKAPTL
jgi:DnaK suppressor protein